jgi:hypothetical protein
MTANDLDCESPSFLSNQHVHHLAMVATASKHNQCAPIRWMARMALYELFYCATSLAAEREIF